MTIGTGIFLSTLLLSVVLVFITTKDRWNWRKIFKFTLVWPMTLVVCLSLIGAAGYYLIEKYKDRAKLQTEMWGLKLGMAKKDVLFLKGQPDNVDKLEQQDSD